MIKSPEEQVFSEVYEVCFQGFWFMFRKIRFSFLLRVSKSWVICFLPFFLLEQKETKIQESLKLLPTRPTLAR